MQIASPASDGSAYVPLRRFYENAADIFIHRPSNLFFPDAWTETFAQGIQALGKKDGFQGRHVLEVGVGIGINALGIMTSPNAPAEFTGTDICDNAVSASAHLARSHGILNVSMICSDLLKNVDPTLLHRVDHIVACIPQVPVPGTILLNDGDNYAHYYTPTGTQWDEWGLGLNAGLLEQATKLAPQATVTLNLSGRPGIERLKDFFERHNRHARVLFERMVPQHIDTSLAYLAETEKHHPDLPFEFFADPEGIKRINADQAEARRVNGEPLFHKIYVISAPALAFKQ